MVAVAGNAFRKTGNVSDSGCGFGCLVAIGTTGFAHVGQKFVVMPVEAFFFGAAAEEAGFAAMALAADESDGG